MSWHNNLNLLLTQFHWLRPFWLLALIPVLALVYWLFTLKRHAHQWQHMIAPELLPFLLDGKTVTPKKSLLWALVFAWVIAVLSLAGPSWIKRPLPVEKNQSAMVIMLDLSQSMVSEDLKPSRLVRARLKITDILRKRKDGQTALIVYAGEAHAVTPLSDDTATMINLLPSLHPNIMPLPGSNTEDAVKMATQMLKDAGSPGGDLLLVTDGVVPEAFNKIHQLISGKNIRLSILGVGGQDPAPIPAGQGGFVRDNKGAIVTTQLNSAELSELAQSNKGTYQTISNDDSDIDSLMPREQADGKKQSTQEREFDQWFDQGHWLVFLLLPVVLFSFRRGFVLMLICIPLLGVSPQPAYALSWDDLWLTKDQQAAHHLQSGDAKTAATEFNNPDWKAAAQYKADNYAAAAEHYAKSNTADAHYNRGNALAKAGKLEDAIKAYDEALKRDPAMKDAQKNKALVQHLLNQQKNQQQNKNQDQKDKDKKDQDQKNQDQKNQDQKDQNKQNQDQQKQDQQNQDQQQKDKQEQNDKQQQDKDQQQNQSQKAQDQQQQNQNAGAQSSSGQYSSAANGKEQQDQNAQQNSSGQSANQSSMTAAQQNAQSSAAGSSGQAAGQQSSAANQPEAMNEQLDPNNMSDEQKKAMEKWLRLVPDDPGGLLRNKFKYQYLQNRQNQEDGNLKLPDNNADQRF